jgi:ferredoxin
MANSVTQSILVVGGGMAGMSAALEAAEAGYDVILVEKNPYLGGRVAQLNKYFPKLCPPYCGLEINFRRMKQNPKLRFFTMAEVVKVSGQEGDFDVNIRINPRYVNEKCTACGECAKACTVEIDDPFNYGLNKTKAAYLPHDLAYPYRYVIDPALVKSGDAQKVKDACPYGAIELDMAAQDVNLKVGAIIWATGWDPYDVSKLDLYGGGSYANVITNVQMERLASGNGPTEGKILRPSDQQAPQNVAFIQCAGSRDENHLRLLQRHLLPGVPEASPLTCANNTRTARSDHLLHRHPGHGRAWRTSTPWSRSRRGRRVRERQEWPASRKTAGEQEPGAGGARTRPPARSCRRPRSTWRSWPRACSPPPAKPPCPLPWLLTTTALWPATPACPEWSAPAASEHPWV